MARVSSASSVLRRDLPQPATMRPEGAGSGTDVDQIHGADGTGPCPPARGVGAGRAHNAGSSSRLSSMSWSGRPPRGAAARHSGRRWRTRSGHVGTADQCKCKGRRRRRSLGAPTVAARAPATLLRRPGPSPTVGTQPRPSSTSPSARAASCPQPAFRRDSVADRLCMWRSSPSGRRTICRYGAAAATTRPTYSCSSDGNQEWAAGD